MSDFNTVAELEARNAEIAERMLAINTEHGEERAMPAEAAEEWNALGEERASNLERIGEINQELEDRRATIAELARSAEHTESERSAVRGFNTKKPGVVDGEDVYDLPANLAMVSGEQLRDRAMRSLESRTFAHPDADRRSAKDQVDKLLNIEALDEAPTAKSSEVALRMLVTGSKDYQRAFQKIASGRQAALTPAEHAAAERAYQVANRALTVGSTGSYPVPYTLDPTLVNVSSGAVNPLRAIADVVQITGETWKGVTTGAITATRVGEVTAATDNTPTLTQPTITVTKAQAFVPFSHENDADWPALQTEMAKLFADAKDVEEASSFVVGAGSSNVPQGVVTGSTTTVGTVGTAAFALADLYALYEALPARFRARGRFLGNLKTYDAIRRFDTAGGAPLWRFLYQGAGENADGNLPPLLNLPAHEASTMATALTTGTKILLFGDFSKYKIVDRIGFDIEYIPNLFDTTTGYPNGTRGMYAYWRNNGAVLHANAFRALITT